jgi:hypothetical protein
MNLKILFGFNIIYLPFYDIDNEKIDWPIKYNNEIPSIPEI